MKLFSISTVCAFLLLIITSIVFPVKNSSSNIEEQPINPSKPQTLTQVNIPSDIPVLKEITQSPTPDPTKFATPIPVNKPINSQQGDAAFFTVNKQVSIGTYAPNDLVGFGNNIQVSQRIVSDLNNLLNAAKADGVDLKVVSGYRSYAKQQEVFEFWIKQEYKKNPNLTRAQAEAIVNNYSAKPGHSEHQLGTTVDILSNETNYQFPNTYNYKFVTWLQNNASKYNFTISYPQGNPEYVYEPWHVRWRPSL